MEQQEHYTRTGSMITHPTEQSHNHASINLAKKASTKLQQAGNKVVVMPHHKTTKHIPGKQPAKFSKRG